MKFACDRCQTKYSIADERVRGKVLKVKCKTCANLITVREARRPSGGGIPTAAPVMSSGAVVADSGSHEAEFNDSSRTVLSAFPNLGVPPQAAPPPLPPRRPTGPAAPLAAPDDGLQWYMALDGQRTGPFSRKQLVDKLVPLPKQADVHVWNEKLGSWKPPADVPAVAADLATRRRPTLPPHAPAHSPPQAPPHVPPPGAHHGVPPGAPRRTPSPPVPALGASAAPARRTSASMQAVGGTSPRLPVPSQVPGPKPVDLFAPAIPARPADPSSLLQTPAPHANGMNGLGANGAVESVTGRGAIQSSSDVLRLLNIPGAAAPSAPPAAPRLMSGSEVVGWTASTGQAARTKNARFIFALLGIIAVVCVVVTLSMKKSKPVSPVAAPKAAVTDPLAAVVEKAAEKTPEPPAPEPPPTAPAPAPAGGRGKVTKGTRGHTPVRGGAATGPTAPPSQQFGGGDQATTPGTPTAPGGGAADRFRDGKDRNITPQISNRPPPSQTDIARVINSNRNGIKTCYQRALLRDSSLTHGKVTVKLSIGISGRVKHVGVDGPTQFRSVEPCMRDVVLRWVFPQASEEYGTEFVYVFQGNE
jgi:predicted Zn finger-like uncharacterized protein